MGSRGKPGVSKPNSGRTKGTGRTKEADKKVMAKAREARTDESMVSRNLTQSISHSADARRISPEVKSYIKQALSATDEFSKKTYLQNFIDGFLEEARREPTGRAGLILASSMFNENLLAQLDEAANKAMAEDRAFARYRLRDTLFSKQQEVFDNNEDSMIEVICSRRAGKTEMNARKLIAACIEENSPCLYLNLTFSNAISQQFNLCLTLAKAFNLSVDKSSMSEGLIHFANGSSIIFRGNNNTAEADKLRGYKFKLVIIDEIGHQRNMKYTIEEVISPATKDYANSQIIMTGTPPRAPHHYSEMLWNNPAVKHYHWTFKDNPHIPNKETVIADIAKVKGISEDDTLIQREYLGIMGCYDRESQVYRGYRTYDNLPNKNFIPTNIYIGVDWGGVDNNAIAVLLADKYAKVAYCSDEFKQNKMSVTEICNKIIEMRARAIDMAKSLNKDFEETKCQVVCDNNELDNLYELSKEYHVPNVCKAYKVDMMFSVQQLAELCRTGAIKIKDKGIVEDEFEQILYKRDPDTDVILNELDDDQYHGDIEAALRYASRQFCVEILGRDALNKSAKKIDTTVNPQNNPFTSKKEEDDGVTWD